MSQPVERTVHIDAMHAVLKYPLFAVLGLGALVGLTWLNAFYWLAYCVFNLITFLAHGVYQLEWAVVWLLSQTLWPLRQMRDAILNSRPEWVPPHKDNPSLDEFFSVIAFAMVVCFLPLFIAYLKDEQDLEARKKRQ